MLGYTNKLVNNIWSVLVQDEEIGKLLYYKKELELNKISEMPKVERPTNALRGALFKGRRIEKLQKEADVVMNVGLYSKISNKEYGRRSRDVVNNVVEIGVLCHSDYEHILDGCRTYALIDLIIRRMKLAEIEGLGELNFLGLYRTKDLAIEYNGYLLHFEISNLKEEK